MDLKDEYQFHHVGIAVGDLNSAIPSFRALFGYEVTTGPFDDLLQNVSVCFMSRGPGDTCIELVAPLGPNSPVDRVLKRGGGTYHVCYQVPDMQAAMKALTARGLVVINGPVPAVAFDMREICWLTGELELLVEIVQAPA